VTSASGLIEDSAQHLEYCSAPGNAPAAQRGGVPAPMALKAIYPAAGIPARVLWHLGQPGKYMVRRFYGVKSGVMLGALRMGGRLPAEVRSSVAAEARRLYVAPVGATLSHPDGKVVADRTGLRVDEAATAARIWAAEPKATVEPVMRVVHARWRTADIAALTDVLSRYRTWIDGSSGRYMNIQKGAGRINNRILFPGETFSALGAIGDVSKQRGWHRAPVIVWGSYTEGVGGGLCQVSSTLYNAVYRAQLKIVERHHHAKRVHYVPRGRDATIAWPDLDFRFMNQRSTPVVLKAYVRGGALWTMVLGKAAAGDKTA
jgi:vancomycin resistance protein YoaR